MCVLNSTIFPFFVIHLPLEFQIMRFRIHFFSYVAISSQGFLLPPYLKSLERGQRIPLRLTEDHMREGWLLLGTSDERALHVAVKDNCWTRRFQILSSSDNKCMKVMITVNSVSALLTWMQMMDIQELTNTEKKLRIWFNCVEVILITGIYVNCLQFMPNYHPAQ